MTPLGWAKVSLKPTVTVSRDFHYKEVLFREQKTVTVSNGGRLLVRGLVKFLPAVA